VNNPPNDESAKPVTKERQKILDDAMMQLQKTRKEMDPTIFTKIRAIMTKNPKVMQALGLSKMPNQKIADSDKNKVLENSGESEKIDQAKNLDIIAKFMTIKPSGKEDVKNLVQKKLKED